MPYKTIEEGKAKVKVPVFDKVSKEKSFHKFLTNEEVEIYVLLNSSSSRSLIFSFLEVVPIVFLLFFASC